MSKKNIAIGRYTDRKDAVKEAKEKVQELVEWADII